MVKQISRSNETVPNQRAITNYKLKEESLMIKANNQALITFKYSNDQEFEVICRNSIIYNTFEQQGIQIPKDRQKEFAGLSRVTLEDPRFPRAFFLLMFPSKRYSENDYYHAIQFGESSIYTETNSKPGVWQRESSRD